jgi:phage terminase small subunit
MPQRKMTIEEKKATGSYRPSSHGTMDPPSGVFGRPAVPAFLTPSQVVIFNDTCDLLEQAEWLRISDGPTLHAYCVLQDRLNRMPDEFTAADFTQFRMLANELGMSPAARAKMPVAAPKKEANDFDDL